MSNFPGKGSNHRKRDKEKFDKNLEGIYGKRTFTNVMSDEDKVKLGIKPSSPKP